MKLVIKHGRVVDPANNLDRVSDILVEHGRISQVAPKINCPAEKTIEAAEKLVLPGLVDMHVHLREPGREDKETVASATKAALKGGITSVLAMPNTSPAMDCPETVELLTGIIQKTAACHVLIAGALTLGRQGLKLTEIAELKKKGVAALTDDGSSVDNDELFFKALKKAQENNLLVISHCEDKKLSAGGSVNLGIISTRMGLKGISSESEYKRVQRDIALAQKAKAKVHIAHVSCQESVELIAQAKKKGVKVTAETAPHYFSLTEEALVSFDPNLKVNPPLRSRRDAEAIEQGLKKGLIDAIATDHAPHTENEKDIEFERAEFGMLGLETALSLGWMKLVEKKILTLTQLVEKMALNPARILGLKSGTLSVGAPADIVIFNPQKEWLVKKEQILSKSKNSAFIGRTLKGVVEYTICQGKIAYQTK